MSECKKDTTGEACQDLDAVGTRNCMASTILNLSWHLDAFRAS